jgi:uncharacterized damage-inducible protein DinB
MLGSSVHRTEIEILTRLAEDAYRNDSSHSLLANLRDLRDGDWTATPPGGNRSICDILEHTGWCKWMYGDYAFGPASMQGDTPPLVPADGARCRPIGELLSWMDAGHARWLAAIRALADDGELGRLRLANWGEQLPTRELIHILIAHDIYHAGEINHIRAILQGSDRWAYE